MLKTNETENLIIHYSDIGHKIRQIETGLVFDFGEVGDEMPCPYTYEELDIPVDTEENDEEIDDAEALNIIMGVSG